LGLPDDRVVVVAGGRVNATKRLEAVITAIAGDSDLRSAVLFAIVGSGDTEYLDHLRRHVRREGLMDQVRFVTDPDDRLLHSYIAGADVCVNLRNPSTESASAALVEQMHFGKPVIVSRTGVYDEMPDDVVVKTDIIGEVSSVRAALRELVFDRDSRARVASFASDYASLHNSPAAYAQHLVEFIGSLGERGGPLRLVDESAGEMYGSPVDDSYAAAVDLLAERLARQVEGIQRVGEPPDVSGPMI
jgi:glycosyltransferase involved in cell wall biosynthesis